MTKIEKLNRRMLLLEREVSISCEEYDTYKALIDAVGHLEGVLMWAAQKNVVLGCEDNHEQAREALEKLK